MLFDLNKDKLKARYEHHDSWSYYASAPGQLEFIRAMALISEHLRPGDRVLDLGCGAGRHAIALAKLGHQVSLADLSSHQLDRARQNVRRAGVSRFIVDFHVADAIDLHMYHDSEFDAVIANGPFFHLTRARERESAAAEIYRVLRPSGVAVIGFMPRLSGYMGYASGAWHDGRHLDAEQLDDVFVTGVFNNAELPEYTHGFSAEIEHMHQLFGDTGYLSGIDVVSLRGLAHGNEAAVLKMRRADPILYSAFMRRLAQSSYWPSVIDTSGPALMIGRSKPH